MARFADILSELEASGDEPEATQSAGPAPKDAPGLLDGLFSRRADSAPRRPRRYVFDADMLDDDDEPCVAAAERPEAPPATEPAIDLDAELSSDTLDSLSAHQLRELRRRLARRVHPDMATSRDASSAAMQRVNCEIDRAIRAQRLR